MAAFKSLVLFLSRQVTYPSGKQEKQSPLPLLLCVCFGVFVITFFLNAFVSLFCGGAVFVCFVLIQTT